MKMENKRFFIMFFSLILFILIIIISILSFNILKDNSYIVNSFKILVIENSQKFNGSNLGPIKDDDKEMISPYEFNVINSGSQYNSYELIIEDIVDNENEAQFLNRKFLRYELKVNGHVKKIGSLADIKNNLLDSGSLDRDEVNSYSLRLWVTGDATDTNWMNKYYNYKLIANPVLN